MALPAKRDRTGRDGSWERFVAAHGDVLDAWLHAEVAMSRALDAGATQPAAGDRLLAAEAALQGAIIDFAADEDAVDPTGLAVELLRHVESHLVRAVQAG